MIELILNHEKAKADLTQQSFKNAVLDATGFNRSDIDEILLMLLEAGADVDMRDDSGETLVMRAMRASTEAVRVILQYRPDLQARDEDENTVLTWLACRTPVEVVKLMIRCGAKLDVQNNLRCSPLITAVGVENTEVVKYLLTLDSVRANINVPAVDGTALHYACQNDDLSAANLLLDHNANINYIMETPVPPSGTAVMRAIMRKNKKCAEMLIERGANVRHPAGYYRYPIIMASLCFTNVDFVALLLRQPGVTIDVTDTLGRKPAHLACLNNLSLLDVLHVPDGDLAARDGFGRYPLHFACIGGNVALLEAVIERSGRAGVGINARDQDGWTPLMAAARAVDAWTGANREKLNQLEIIKLLLDRGADPALDAEGFKVESAEENGRLAAADIARYHQADAEVVRLLDKGLPAGRKKIQEVGQPADVTTGETLYCDSCFAVSKIPANVVSFPCVLWRHASSYG